MRSEFPYVLFVFLGSGLSDDGVPLLSRLKSAALRFLEATGELQ